MLRPKLAGPSLAVLLVAASASAAPVQVEGRFRSLTVSGEALVHFQLVPSGKTLQAAVTGPLSVAVKLRRHSRGRARGRTEAIVTVDGKAPERIVLPADPAGSYLAGFGFRPGPESVRRIELGAGPHEITIRARGGALAVAVEAAPALAAVPLVASAPPPAASAPPPAAAASPPPVVAAASPPPAAKPAPAATPAVEAAASPRPRGDENPRWLFELRGGGASQAQLGSAGFSGGIDARYYVVPRISLGLSVDAMGLGFGTASGYPSAQAIHPISRGSYGIGVPILVEGVYDQPLGGPFRLCLGIGAGATDLVLSGSEQAGPTALPASGGGGFSPAAAALAGFFARIPSGRIGVEVRATAALPETSPGVVRGAVPGALLWEVGYQLLVL